MKRFWLSWEQPTEDYRPLTDPPHEAVIGWWCSGYASNYNATLCAVVAADTLEKAKKAVRDSWPEAPSQRVSWRIDDTYDAGWLPNASRFPLNDWMLKRHEETKCKA